MRTMEDYQAQASCGVYFLLFFYNSVKEAEHICGSTSWCDQPISSDPSSELP